MFERAVEITDRAARADPHDQASRSRLATAARSLGDIVRHTDPRRALEAYDLALSRLAEIPNNVAVRREQATVLANSSDPLLQLHRAAEAKRRIDAAFAVLRETHDYPAEQIGADSEAFGVLCAQADFEAQQGELSRAIGTYEQLLNNVTQAQFRSMGDLRDAIRLSDLYAALGSLYRRADAGAKAGDLESRRLELWRNWDRKLPNNSFVQRQLQKPVLNSAPASAK